MGQRRGHRYWIISQEYETQQEQNELDSPVDLQREEYNAIMDTFA